jgi:hypothetical protein
MINVHRDISLVEVFKIIRNNFKFLIWPVFLGLVVGLIFANQIPQTYKSTFLVRYDNLAKVSSTVQEFQIGYIDRVKVLLKAQAYLDSSEKVAQCEIYNLDNVLGKTITLPMIKLIHGPQAGLYEITIEARGADNAKKCEPIILEFIKSEYQASVNRSIELLQKKINIYYSSLGDPRTRLIPVQGSQDIYSQTKQSEVTSIMVSEYIDTQFLLLELKNSKIIINFLTGGFVSYKNLAFIYYFIGILIGLVVGILTIYVKNLHAIKSSA